MHAPSRNWARRSTPSCAAPSLRSAPLARALRTSTRTSIAVHAERSEQAVEQRARGLLEQAGAAEFGGEHGGDADHGEARGRGRARPPGRPAIRRRLGRSPSRRRCRLPDGRGPLATRASTPAIVGVAARGAQSRKSCGAEGHQQRRRVGGTGSRSVQLPTAAQAGQRRATDPVGPGLAPARSAVSRRSLRRAWTSRACAKILSTTPRARASAGPRSARVRRTALQHS